MTGAWLTVDAWTGPADKRREECNRAVHWTLSQEEMEVGAWRTAEYIDAILPSLQINCNSLQIRVCIPVQIHLLPLLNLFSFPNIPFHSKCTEIRPKNKQYFYLK